MTTDQLYGFKQELNAQGILFCYSGPVSQGLIEEIGEVMKRKMEMQETRLTMIQKVFGIFVEQVQNIMNYSAEGEPVESGASELRAGIVVIGREERGFYILCGNLIENQKKETLLQCLKQVEGKDKTELKMLYKQRLKAGRLEVGKGAGLGLIDVARKASGPLEYRFQEIDERYGFFSSKVTIEGGDGCNR